MSTTRPVSLANAMYWRIARFRAWLMLIGLVIVGAALSSTMGAS